MLPPVGFVAVTHACPAVAISFSDMFRTQNHDSINRVKSLIIRKRKLVNARACALRK
jgi:hypothetical protein